MATVGAAACDKCRLLQQSDEALSVCSLVAHRERLSDTISAAALLRIRP